MSQLKHLRRQLFQIAVSLNSGLKSLRVTIMILAKILSALLDCLRGVIRLERSYQALLQQHEIQEEKIDRILAAVEPLPAEGFVFDTDLEGQFTEGVTKQPMTNSQKFTATIKPVDKRGKPALIDGVPEWSTDNDIMVGLTPSTDGLSCEVTALGPEGACNVSVSGDADLGAGSKPIFGVLGVTITHGEAVGFEIVAGTPVDQ